MKIIKNELQDIITGNGKEGESCLIKKAQIHIRGNEIPGFQSSKFQHLKSEEEHNRLN